jgi:cytochrome c-type biogenesis protein CcmH/NrfG
MNPTTEHVVYAAIALFVLAICAAGAYKLRSYFVARALEQGAAALARQHHTYTNTQYV